MGTRHNRNGTLDFARPKRQTSAGGIWDRWREVALDRRELRRPGRFSHDTRAAILFLLPFLVPYVVLKLWPIVYGFWISLHNWSSIGGTPTFVGTQNYERILKDRCSGGRSATLCSLRLWPRLP